MSGVACSSSTRGKQGTGPPQTKNLSCSNLQSRFLPLLSGHANVLPSDQKLPDMVDSALKATERPDPRLCAVQTTNVVMHPIGFARAVFRPRSCTVDCSAQREARVVYVYASTKPAFGASLRHPHVDM